MLANGKQAKIIWNAAREGHWAMGAFNIMDYNTAEAVIRAAEELDVPVCLQMMDGYNPEAPEGRKAGAGIPGSPPGMDTDAGPPRAGGHDFFDYRHGNGVLQPL